ncbi:MAG: hypothetical protein JO345_21920 [Streptosporangiaceae bacterium]|nr:hypothetical protein [Streptosporangiaceae bacterium]
MEIAQTPAKLDDFDVRQLKEMLASRPFALVRQRLAAELERQRGICERGDAPLEIHRAQGAAQALRTALALPERVLEEITASVKGGK